MGVQLLAYYRNQLLEMKVLNTNTNGLKTYVFKERVNSYRNEF